MDNIYPEERISYRLSLLNMIYRFESLFGLVDRKRFVFYLKMWIPKECGGIFQFRSVIPRTWVRFNRAMKCPPNQWLDVRFRPLLHRKRKIDLIRLAVAIVPFERTLRFSFRLGIYGREVSPELTGEAGAVDLLKVAGMGRILRRKA
jgi:hypothetical protein